MGLHYVNWQNKYYMSFNVEYFFDLHSSIKNSVKHILQLYVKNRCKCRTTDVYSETKYMLSQKLISVQGHLLSR